MAARILKTRVLIIGGGVTGTGLARDLAMRGVEATLVEKSDINAGASGGNHGLLHSGARYVFSDPSSAAECAAENLVLKRVAPRAIEDTGGLFVAVEGDDENYVADFPSLCEASGIRAEPLDLRKARELEPVLSEKLIAAYRVDDAAVDPFMLSLDNIAHAGSLGATLLRDTLVASFEIRNGKIAAAVCENTETGEKTRIEADIVVNACGAWAKNVAAMAGRKIGMVYSKGSLLVTHNRLARMVINRLRHPTDADILVPGGTVSILGTTSVRVESPDDIYPEILETERIVDEGAAMVPELAKTRYIRAYCGVRPLVSFGGQGDDRIVSRGYALIDHAKEGVENFITITGGKLTTYRLMAEKTADLVCGRLGVSAPCATDKEPLPASPNSGWTEPGIAPKHWIKQKDRDDVLLCECEMVPKSVIDSIAASIRDQGGQPGLNAIGLRSRVGKGPCQGTFCSQRVAAYLYDRHEIEGEQGLKQIGEFLNRRWRGQRPFLEGAHLMQYELQEAIHCGIFGLELENPEDGE